MIHSNNCDSISERSEKIAASGIATLHPKSINKEYENLYPLSPGKLSTGLVPLDLR